MRSVDIPIVWDTDEPATGPLDATHANMAEAPTAAQRRAKISAQLANKWRRARGWSSDD
jgi:hypothetical protein